MAIKEKVATIFLVVRSSGSNISSTWCSGTRIECEDGPNVFRLVQVSSSKLVCSSIRSPSWCPGKKKRKRKEKKKKKEKEKEKRKKKEKGKKTTVGKNSKRKLNVMKKRDKYFRFL